MTHTDDDHRPVRTLLDQLTNQDVEIRQAAISELEKLLGERPGHVAWGRETILTRLEDPDPTVRAAACRIVAALGIKEARSQLDDLRLDPDATVSNVASESLPRLREADRVEPIEPPTGGGAPTTADSSEPTAHGDEMAADSTGRHGQQPTPEQSNPQASDEKSTQQPRREQEPRQRQQPQQRTQSQKAHQQPQSQSRQAQSQPSHRQTPPHSTQQQQSTGTPVGQEGTHQGRRQQTQPTRNAEPHDETASRKADGMGGKTLAVTAGYGLLGLSFAILPAFLMGAFPPDTSIGVGPMMAGYMTLAGGIIVLVAAALKGAGKPAETARGVAIFGSLLAIVGTVLIFVL